MFIYLFTILFISAKGRVENMSLKCGKNINESIEYVNKQGLIQQWEDLDGRKVNFADIESIFNQFTIVLKEYIGKCKNFQTWEDKQQTQINKIKKQI